MIRAAVCILLLGLWLQPASCTTCKDVVEQHLRTRTKEAVPYHPDNMVFFLHVPRTAGRTFHTCLLKPGTPDDRRCPRAYDHLRISAEVPQCHLLSSHDDFSVVDMMSKHLTVVTQLRDPVDRILSAYEFAVELATRALKRKKAVKTREGRVATDEVWPWSYFIPWFKEDLQRREDELNKAPQPEQGTWVEMVAADGRVYHLNKAHNATRWPEAGVTYSDVLPLLDPYNNPLVMPLEEFIKHPIAKELLHEGGMLQVLGTTNYSHFEEAKEVRECLFSDAEVHQTLLQVALKRLDTFAHVGAMDQLDDSVRSAAASLHMELDAQAFSVKPPGHLQRDNLQQQGRHMQQSRQLLGEQGLDTTAADVPAEENAAGDDDEDLDEELADGQVGAEEASGEGKSAVGVEQEQREAAAAQLAQATSKLQEAQSNLRLAIKGGGSSEEVQHWLHQLDEAKAMLRDAQTALRESGAVHPARKLKQHRDEQGRLRTADSLATLYRRCMARSQQRNKRRKRVSLALLRMPDGRAVFFSKEARAALPDRIINAIRDMNKGDKVLYDKAREMLRSQLKRHEQQGVLQELPAARQRRNQHRQRFPAGDRTGMTSSSMRYL